MEGYAFEQGVSMTSAGAPGLCGRAQEPQYHIVIKMLGSVFLSTMSPVVTLVCLMTTPGFSFSHPVI